MIRLAIAHFLDELVIDVPIILFAEEFRHLAFLSLAPWDSIVCILSRATSEQRRRKKRFAFPCAAQPCITWKHHNHVVVTDSKRKPRRGWNLIFIFQWNYSSWSGWGVAACLAPFKLGWWTDPSENVFIIGVDAIIIDKLLNLVVEETYNMIILINC